MTNIHRADESRNLANSAMLFVMPVDGTKLKAARERKGWTQETLATKSRVSQPNISKIERGEVIKSDAGPALAKALGVSLASISSGAMTETHVDRTDVEPMPSESAEGVDVEPLSRAVSAEHAEGDWTDAEILRARTFIHETHRKLEPHADMRELARAILRAIRRAGADASDRDIALAWAQGKPVPARPVT
jgi:transcriptional regulator with XRE-family HTH domain